jgi:hypothetical protein
VRIAANLRKSMNTSMYDEKIIEEIRAKKQNAKCISIRFTNVLTGFETIKVLSTSS